MAPVPGSPFAAGRYPVWPTFDPTGTFLYINSYDSNEIHGFRIDALTGALAPVPRSPFRTGSSTLPGTYPREPIIDPFGKYLYLPNRKSDSVSGFSIEPDTGSLTPIPGSPFPPCGPATLKYKWKVLKMAAKAVIRGGVRSRRK
jgi:6-phosphogluconolactonase (cycloisomerase 2 family)